MKQYTIGQVSQALDISIQAIRLYQKKGLIKPSYVNEVTGYRYYDDEQISKLWRIKILQSAGFELKEILEMEKKSLTDLENIIQEKKEMLEKVIRQKTLAMNYLDRQLGAIKAWEKEEIIQLQWIDDRYGISFAKERRYSFLDHMQDIGAIKGSLELNHEVTYLPSKRLYLKDGQMIVRDLFAMNDLEGEGLSVQEGGWYLCCYVKGRGRHREIYDKMFNYAKENGFTLRGDAIELILINGNLVNNNDYDIKQIQLAVMKV